MMQRNTTANTVGKRFLSGKVSPILCFSIYTLTFSSVLSMEDFVLGFRRHPPWMTILRRWCYQIGKTLSRVVNNLARKMKHDVGSKL
jgi:hypothetical protein